MTEPYYSPYETSVDDGEGTAAHPVPGIPGATQTTDYLPPWYTVGYTAQLGPDGTFVYTPLIPSQSPYVDFADFPSDLTQFTKVTGRYFSPDGDPLGGFLTFMPSSGVTVTENGVSYRIPRRLAGTETWPALDSGVSPWAFSMEGSGNIYIWLGLMVVKLLPCDNSNIVTDDGEPLTYHVVEHFIGGKQFDITVPTTTNTVDLYSAMRPGTMRPNEFDPVNPMGSLLGDELRMDDISEFGDLDRCQSQLSVEYDSVNLSDVPALQNVAISGSNTVQFAYTSGPPTSSTAWSAGQLIAGGPPWQAQILVGPNTGTVTLTPGRYERWVALTNSPQYIVARAGSLTIY